MKIIVTGALGFIGSHFCELAIKQGHTVVGVDSLTYSGRSKNLEGANMFCYVQDICDAQAIEKILSDEQPGAVVHFAAESHVARSIESREEFLRTNVLGTNTLLEESLKYWRGDTLLSDATKKVFLTPFTNHMRPKEQLSPNPDFRFLHVSTDEVYGSLYPYAKPWTESSPYQPNNGYSASKAASDHLVRSYHNTYGLPVITTHSANNYGSRQHPEKLIPTLIRQCMNGHPITLHGDGQHIRDWLHVEDHCMGVLAALEHGKVGEVYNFGGECERTNQQIAELILAQFALTPFKGTMIRYVDDRPGNDRRYSTDISKVCDELHWKPRGTIEEHIGEVVKWYTGHPTYSDDYGK